MNPSNNLISSDTVKHSAAHVLATAVSRIYPNVRVGIGPVNKKSFFYDFDIPDIPSEDVVSQIEAECVKIEEENLAFQQVYLEREKAIDLMLQKGQIYKAELINFIPDAEISFYKTGEEFVDLCRGPHVANTSMVGPLKITNVEKVHWNEDPTRPQLVRIHAITFRDQGELNTYLARTKAKENFSITKVLKNRNYIRNLETELAISSDLFRIANRIKRRVLLPYQNTLITPFNIKDGKILFPTDQVFYQLNASDHRDMEFIFTRTIKGNENFKVLETINNAVKIFDLENTDFLGEIEFHTNDSQLADMISNQLQANFISHNKVLNKSTDKLKLELKVVDKYGEEWIVGTITIEHKENGSKQQLLSLKAVIHISTYVSYILITSEGRFQENPSISPYDVAIIPINTKHEGYAIETYEYILKYIPNLEIKVFKGNYNLKKKVALASKLGTSVLLFIGDKEVISRGVSLRKEGVDQGLIKLDDIEEYID